MPPTDEINPTTQKPIPSAPAPEAKQEEAPRAYAYPHATDHAPIAPVPDEPEHEVQSFGGAPEGGT